VKWVKSWDINTKKVNRQQKANSILKGHKGIWSDPMNSPVLKLEMPRMNACQVIRPNMATAIISVKNFAKPWPRRENISVNTLNRIWSPLWVTEGKASAVTPPKSMLLISIVSGNPDFSAYLATTSSVIRIVMTTMAIPLKKCSFWVNAVINLFNSLNSFTKRVSMSIAQRLLTPLCNVLYFGFSL
jgi:hypothetical protein